MVPTGKKSLQVVRIGKLSPLQVQLVLPLAVELDM